MDLVILVVLALGLLLGLKTGLIRQVLGLAGIVCAFILGFIYMEPVGTFLRERFDASAQFAPIAGFAAVFLSVQVGVLILVRLLQTVIGVLKLGLVNRLLGGVLGGFSAALVLSILFRLLAPTGVLPDQALKNSQLYGPVSSILPEAWELAVSTFPGIMELSERFGVESPEPADQ